uniref:L-xylulose reductase n=1 Tax=Syphacia muris TaxID=451379 RepID=A0A0N5AE63_9BILA
MSEFEGRRVLVTGANRGIGKAIVIALAKLKANVVAFGRNKQQLEELSKQFPNVSTVICDVTDSAEKIKLSLKPFQPFHYLVNNAGIVILEDFVNLTEEALTKQFQVNVRGPLIISQIVVSEMIEHGIHGSIVNISSQSSMKPLQAHTAYCSTKAALDMATKVMAKELGKYSIRVNCVNPTVVMTEMGKQVWSDENKAKGVLDRIPLNKFAEEVDVVNSVIFLLSENSRMTTGSALFVDGGYVNA